MRYVRTPHFDRNLRNGDAFTADAWRNEIGETLYVAVGVDPNIGEPHRRGVDETVQINPSTLRYTRTPDHDAGLTGVAWRDTWTGRLCEFDRGQNPNVPPPPVRLEHFSNIPVSAFSDRRVRVERDVLFRGKRLDDLTREEAIEALKQALEEVARLWSLTNL